MATEARAGVKILWAESERGAGTIVGGEWSKGGLWVVRGGEVNSSYLESEYHSEFVTLIGDEEEGTGSLWNLPDTKARASFHTWIERAHRHRWHLL